MPRIIRHLEIKTMIGLIAQLRIKPGTNSEFESAMQAMAEKVRSDEPGCLLYTLHRTDDENLYLMMEQYVDQDALAAHRKTPHMRELGAALGQHMDGAPDVKVYPAVE